MSTSEDMTSSQISWYVQSYDYGYFINELYNFQDLHNMDVTSESVQLTELDNNKYVGAGWQNGGHHGIQEYTM